MIQQSTSPDDFQAQLRRLARRLQRLARHPATRRAGGAPFFPPRERGRQGADIRDYAPGDPLGQVDWALCARRDELLTRPHASQPPERVELLIDCSPSMTWEPEPMDREIHDRPPRVVPGSSALASRRSKLAVARRAAAVIGCAALATGAEVVVAGFCHDLLLRSRAVRGLRELPRLLSLLDDLPTPDGPTSLECSAARLLRACRTPGMVVLLSDLYDRAGFAPALDRLRNAGYLPGVVQVYEQAEADPDWRGELELVDVEPTSHGESSNDEGSAGRAAIITLATMAAYRRRFARLLYEVRSFCTARNMPWTQLTTELTDNEIARLLLGVGLVREEMEREYNVRRAE